jgi:hypothetical protein
VLRFNEQKMPAARKELGWRENLQPNLPDDLKFAFDIWLMPEIGPPELVA